MDKLKELGDLYEEGKDCLNSLGILENDRNEWSRVYEILREMRDLAAVAIREREELTQGRSAIHG